MARSAGACAPTSPTRGLCTDRGQRILPPPMYTPAFQHGRVEPPRSQMAVGIGSQRPPTLTCEAGQRKPPAAVARPRLVVCVALGECPGTARTSTARTGQCPVRIRVHNAQKASRRNLPPPNCRVLSQWPAVPEMPSSGSVIYHTQGNACATRVFSFPECSNGRAVFVSAAGRGRGFISFTSFRLASDLCVQTDCRSSTNLRTTHRWGANLVHRSARSPQGERLSRVDRPRLAARGIL